MGYRKDIDGLRCVAVTAVVLYHFGLSAPGGFVGVDVFFVISGYLITAQIAGDIEAQRFSLLTFYARRCKRILPALLVVCTACLLAGWFVLWPGDYKALAASVRYAAFGLANFYFLWNTGYFDQASDLLPMLHLWSLGVEEQFYFAWPALLLLALPLGRRWLIALLLALIAISLGASINAVAADQKAAFYLPHLRAWELAIGGLLVFLPHMRLPSYAREILGAAAALLILGAIVMLTKASPFPGLSALPPVIGAALLIWHTMHGGSSAVSRLLSLAPAVFVGKISYSLYLWHWPVLVLFRHINNGAMPSLPESIALVAASVLLSTATWICIEQPGRRLKLPNVGVVGASGAAMLALLMVAITVKSNQGYPQRLRSEAQAFRSLDAMWSWACPGRVVLPGGDRQLCTFGADWDSARTRVFLWGDSHAEHLAPLLHAMSRQYPDHDTAFVLFDACSSIIGGDIKANRPSPPTTTKPASGVGPRQWRSLPPTRRSMSCSWPRTGRATCPFSTMRPPHRAP